MNKTKNFLETEKVINLGFPEKPKKSDLDSESFPSKLGGKPVY